MFFSLAPDYVLTPVKDTTSLNGYWGFSFNFTVVNLLPGHRFDPNAASGTWNPTAQSHYKSSVFTAGAAPAFRSFVASRPRIGGIPCRCKSRGQTGRRPEAGFSSVWRGNKTRIRRVQEPGYRTGSRYTWLPGL